MHNGKKYWSGNIYPTKGIHKKNYVQVTKGRKIEKYCKKILKDDSTGNCTRHFGPIFLK